MAERAGVDMKVLRAVLNEDPTVMPDDVALAWRFTRVTIDHDPSWTSVAMKSSIGGDRGREVVKAIYVVLNPDKLRHLTSF
jgi:hypothetical protein